MTRQRKILVIASLSVLLLGMYYLLPNINITLTDSLDYHLFYRSDAAPQPGDYVLFPFKHPLLDNKALELTKKICCSEGQTLSSQGQQFYCDGQFLGTAKTETLEGEPMPLFNYSGPVPDNHAFVMGSHPDSFDSRYWGFLDLSQSTKMHPVL